MNDRMIAEMTNATSGKCPSREGDLLFPVVFFLAGCNADVMTSAGVATRGHEVDLGDRLWSNNVDGVEVTEFTVTTQDPCLECYS